MLSVVVPCGGLYRRFPAGMPKYIRPLNDMRPMIAWAVESVNTTICGPAKFYYGVRRQDNDEWGVADIIRTYCPCDDVVVLDRETQGPADTVQLMLSELNISGPFVVKDCDCSWKPKGLWPTGHAAFVAWRETAVGDRGSKSWVQLSTAEDVGSLVVAIREKQTPTDWYCCGGYQFADAQQFRDIYELLARASGDREIYCSHVLQHMISAGALVDAAECSDPNDWGTFEKYVEWRRRRRAYFIDIDGVITTAGAPYGKHLWKDSKVLPGAADRIRGLRTSGCSVYLLTSRPESEREATENLLSAAGITWNGVLYGVQNGPRVVINDWAPSNPYPSAEAINTPRDSGQWMDMLS